jgi:hypothetical protein
MKEVIEFEDIIRRATPRARDEAPIALIAEALAIMRGLPPAGSGSRKDNLRRIADQMKAFLPITVEIDRLAELDDDFDADPNEGCPNKGGHEFIEEDTDDGSEGRSYCQHCLADGDA